MEWLGCTQLIVKIKIFNTSQSCLYMKNFYYFLVLLFISPNAHAYVDPGSSLLMLQGLLAAVGGVLIFIRHPIQTAKSFWHKFKKPKNKAENA